MREAFFNNEAQDYFLGREKRHGKNSNLFQKLED
jgi:hypothetical protein